MINRPLAYKGPVDHLRKFFSEDVLLQGLALLLEDNLVNWQNQLDEKYIKGTCLCDGQFTKQILYWPLTRSLGSCSCQDSGRQANESQTETIPCVHLAALAIESKTRLHRLPPSTNQQTRYFTGKKYIKKWLTGQKLDPFPKMARHRVIYLLEHVGSSWIISVHKAYLTKESVYQMKAPINLNDSIDGELEGNKNTKFFSLIDQQILYFINHEYGCRKLKSESNQFEILLDEKANRLVKNLVQTDRLFWQSSHRQPLVLSARHRDLWRQVSEAELELISENYYLDLKNNAVIEVFEQAAAKSKKLFYQLMNLREFDVKPVLKITSTEIAMPWKKEQVKQFDVAKLSFLVNGKEFSLKTLLPLVLEREANKAFSEELADYLLQIENLSLLEARYEIPAIEKFHFGDREFDKHISHMLPILNGLHAFGWKIEISRGFRLNRITSQNWYIDLIQGLSNNKATIQQTTGDRSQDKPVFENEEKPQPIQLDLLPQPKNLSTSKQPVKVFDWFELEIGVKVEGRSINLMPYIVSLIQREKLNFKDDSDVSQLQIKLESGETLFLERDRVKAIFSSFVELNDEKNLSKENRLKFPSNQFGRLIPLIEVEKIIRSEQKIKTFDNDKPFALDWQSGKQLANKAKQLANETKVTKVNVPRELRGELRDYQQAGLNWLQFIHKHNLGGILADDMGLGKTIQTITHILVEKKNGRLKTPCLVIAPTSLLPNWLQEIQKFAPSLQVMKLAGSKRSPLYSKLANMDVVITSYGLALRDINKLSRTQFHLLILDEAQVIKNTRSKITSAVKNLHSNQRLCLTGTPMENHLGELWSLFHFLMPDFLGSEYQFNQLYRQPIEKNQDYLRQSLLAKRVAPLMLRRTKNEVAKELPSKTEMVTLIELEEAQADLYETIRTSMIEQVHQAMTLETSHRNQFLIGNALLKLRQVCCHSSLIKLESAQKNNSSAKIAWLKDRLPTMVEQGRRILLFSSFTSMLDIIAKELETMSLSFLTLTGKSKHRGALVERFQKGNTPIFLISLKAGGVGLNLTAADTVIHYDPWWNPAAEQQANDRAYRIGQDKPVFVYKLITKGTVEEKIQQMQQQKNKLSQGLYDQEALDTMNLTADDWQALFQPIDGF